MPKLAVAPATPFQWNWFARGFVLCSLLAGLIFERTVYAHVGSPDVFYSGLVGPYPARITIRMPGVIPGRAQICLRVQSPQPVQVSFLPLYAHTPLTNAPPPDPGLLVSGETNLYCGELWLMSFGAYSINVRLSGEKGDGQVQVPVNSVATRQLPLPSFLGKLLLLLGVVLFCAGIGIVAAAARDSTLAPGALPGKRERRKGLIAAGVTLIILVPVLAGGRKWWAFEETDFRRHLREGAWPDLSAEVRSEGSQRILTLTLGQKAFPPNHLLSLVPDHGKLLHFFLIREPGRDAFAHLHPVRKGGKTFEVAVPEVLPEGDYKIFCDMTFEDSGLSSTATNTVHLPAISGGAVVEGSLQPDQDDSWSVYAPANVTVAAAGEATFQLTEGRRVIWHSANPIHAKTDASLRFEVRDAAGQPLALEPYMGMLSHAAVLRSDEKVFAHLHPTGNFSMAAQGLFETRIQRETGQEEPKPAEMEHAHMKHNMHASSTDGSVSLPYEFPLAGEYRVWLQFKNDGQVLTAVFDAKVIGP